MPVVRPAELDARLIDNILGRIHEGKPIRRMLPIWGRIHVDRRLPFVFLYRHPVDRPDAGTEMLLLGEPGYVLASGEQRIAEGLGSLLAGLAQDACSMFGSFLMIELWASPEAAAGSTETSLKDPAFWLYHGGETCLFPAVEAFERSLRSITLSGMRPYVASQVDTAAAPPGLGPALCKSALAMPGMHSLGIEVRPIYRAAGEPKPFPLALRELRRAFSRAVKHALVEFVRHGTRSRPTHYQMLGRRTVVKAVWRSDRILAEVADEFDFLLAATPVNLNAAWHAFRRRRRSPRFGYRPLLIAPGELKRKLFSAPIRRVEDPELRWMLRRKQRELDLQLTALGERDSLNFRHLSLLLYGGIDQALLDAARVLLERVPRTGQARTSARWVTAEQFARRARQEIAAFQTRGVETGAQVEVREEVSGLLVSKGNLLVGADLRIRKSRVEALIQHEVGTHILTHINGSSQPLTLLRVGLAAYDGLQEGLAVLGEHLVGGLSGARVRLLAARVVAVQAMVENADFVEVWRLLRTVHGYTGRTAFGITARVFRSGGLTKDAVYLRGLLQVLDYLVRGGDLDPLLVGKIGIGDLGVIEELLTRGILRRPTLVPSYFTDAAAIERLAAARRSRRPLDLLVASK